ncbi:hypothetical protein [Synechococcus sp. PCC 7336]|uniref:hypothetical protein n=1 Tax=Synechococcus sp. PCC 7336 TaxID=195250 RepID=UPI000348E9A0|nr:hypothetical protein [Synechococcus sp. PCC 7336]
MASKHPSERDLRQREAELKQRELALRLRELEVDLARGNEGRRQTVAPAKRPNKIRRWWQMAVNGLKFFAVVVAVVAAVRVAFWLAGALMVLTVSWLIYKLFFESSFRGDNFDD